MNRIYKVIWSKVKHQYVVTSEFAHGCTKSTGRTLGRSAAAVLAAFVLTAGVGVVPVGAVEIPDDGQGNTGTYEETAPTFDANSKNNVSNGEGNTFTYANENEVKGDLNTLKGEDGKTTDKNTVQGDSNILTSSSNNIVNGGITNKLGSGETARFDGGNELTSSNDNTITGDNNTLDSSSGNSIIGGKAELVGHGAEYRAEGGNTLTNSNTNNIQGEQNKLTNADNNTIVGGTLVVKHEYNGAVEGGNELRNADNNTITGDKNRVFEASHNIITGDSNEIGEFANNPYNDPDIELGINLDSNVIEGSSNKIHNGSNNAIEGDGNNVGRKDYDPSSENDIMGNTNTLYAASQNNITGNSNRLTNASNNEVYGNSNVLNNGYNASSKADNNHIWGDNNELQHTIDTWILGSNNKLGTTSKDSQNNFIIGNSNTFGRDGNTYAVTNSLVFGNNNKTGDGLINSTLIGSNMQLGKLTAGTGGSDIKNSVVIGQDIVAPLGSEFMLIGSNINAESANKAVVVGANTGTVKERSTILGYETSADEGAVAIGLKASAIGDNSVAIGPQARTTEWNSVAIGYNSGTGEGSSYAIALGRSTAVAKDSQSAIAIGSYAYVGEGATSSIAIGANGRWGGSEGNPGATWSEDHSGVGDGSYQSIAMGSAAVVGAKAQNSIAIGGLDTRSGQYDPNDGIETVNVGSGSVNATVVGVDSFVGKDSTFGTVYGSKAKIDDNVNYATAIGSEAFVSGSNSLAAGYSAKAEAKSAVATGDNAQALADNSVAIGKDSLVTNKKSDGTDRIEAGTTITTENSIAIGAGSQVTADTIFTGNDLQSYINQGHNEAWNIKSADTNGVISVGTAGNERRIVNVARGRVDATSTDAINGSQLYALASEFDSKLDGAGGAWNLTTNANPNDDEQTVIGKNNTVDFSGTIKDVQVENEDTGEEITTEHQNIQVSQETQYEEDGENVKGTNVTFDLNDRIILGDSTEPYNQVILDGLTGSVYVGGLSGVSIAKDPAYGNGYIINGLANTEWTYANYTNGVYEDSGKAATEAQLHDAFGYLDNKINNMEILPGDDNVHIDHPDYEKPDTGTGEGETGVGEGGITGGSGTGEGALDNPNAHYVGLKNDVTIGGRDDNENGVFDPEEEGSFAVTRGDGSQITINHDLNGDGVGDGVMNGLTNTEWDWNKYGKPAAEGGYDGSTNAATESQIQGALEGTVQYDRNEDGTVNKGDIYLDQGGTVIHNVAAGTADTDAVNVSQLNEAWDQINNNTTAITNIGNKVGELDSRIDEVGAGAAALAALHPLDFDPDDKWDFAAGYGNYRGENAVAIGAFYRPNEDTMFSVGGTVGNDDNMVNAGVSFKIGQGNGVSTSRVAMAKEIKDLRRELEAMKSAMLDVNAGRKLDTSKLQLFPDVPQNHWAYEYVATLAGNGVIEGYPDGNFDGARPMTRYEFAAMLYRAMLNGAKLSDKILTEFAPELERFTVDVVHTDSDGNPTVERVRVVKQNKDTTK